MRKRSLVCVLLPFLCCLLGPPAAGAADPSSNFVVSPNCSGPAPCLAEAIQFLDQARASLGEAPYQLPAGFASLDPARQAFVLTNLDRLAAGLRPITGLTTALDGPLREAYMPQATRRRPIRVSGHSPRTGPRATSTCRSPTRRGCTTMASAATTSIAPR